MGRPRTGESERDILRRLAEDRRENRPREFAERNAKIEKMIRLGCSYQDIACRYGIEPATIQSLIRRGDVKVKVKDCFESSRDIGRGCYMDGVLG